MKGTSEFIQAGMDILAEVFFDDTTLLSHVGAEVMHAEPVSLLLSWQCRGTGELFTHHTVCPLLCSVTPWPRSWDQGRLWQRMLRDPCSDCHCHTDPEGAQCSLLCPWSPGEEGMTLEEILPSTVWL